MSRMEATHDPRTAVANTVRRAKPLEKLRDSDYVGGAYIRRDTQCFYRRGIVTIQNITRRVFTSFAYEDLHYTNLVGAWSANDNDDFKVYEERLKIAVNSKDADYIKSQLRPKIDRSKVLLCIIGPTTFSSTWVNWEIEYAKSKGKGLVGVETKPDVTIPHELNNSGAVFVPYKKEDINKAIDWAATAGKTEKNWRYSS